MRAPVPSRLTDACRLASSPFPLACASARCDRFVLLLLLLPLVRLPVAASSVRSGRAESDARYGGFDFRAAHEAAPADLRELLDNTESLPFRRRGYERDGMLR